jgi:transposase
MKPYSKDLRLRVLAAVDAGNPREEVARTFSVSMPTIKRWLRRRRETGDVEPEPIPGRPSRKGAMLKEWLPNHLQANDDFTLEEHREAFEEEFGEEVSTSTIGRAIASLPDGGWPIKKVTDSLRARRASQGFVAVAGFSLRRQAPCIRGRERLEHFHDAPESQGSERKESLWQGSQKPRQEHYPDRCYHPPRRYG